MSYKQKFTVKRSKWANAHSVEDTNAIQLSNYLGMCCLGFVCLQLGAKEEEINNIDAPEGAKTNKILGRLVDEFGRHLKWVNRAMAINDDLGISNPTREHLLTELFQENGYDLEFVD